MIVLGVTGGIGSGKSTACRIFEDLGARVFYADDVAKRLMVEDDSLRAGIKETFGDESYTADGQLNRAYLADIVFSDDDKLATLNRLVHKHVRTAFEHVRETAESEGVELLIEEAALIFETGIDAELDFVAVVDAPEEERVRRVVERDSTTPEDVRARMNHQMSADEKRRRADFVLDNSGTTDNLRRQVEELHTELLG